MKRRKQKTVGQLKKELWKLFSLWTKLSSSSDGRWCKCFTCGNPLEIGTSNCQGGHLFPKKGYPYHYFNEKAVQPQCYHCNINLSGNTNVFVNKTIEKYGQEEYDKMYADRHKEIKRTRSDYVELIGFYKEKIRNYKA